MSKLRAKFLKKNSMEIYKKSLKSIQIKNLMRLCTLREFAMRLQNKIILQKI